MTDFVYDFYEMLLLTVYVPIQLCNGWTDSDQISFA